VGKEVPTATGMRQFSKPILLLRIKTRKSLGDKNFLILGWSIRDLELCVKGKMATTSVG